MDMGSPSVLFLSVMVSAIGAAYMLYGKKQQRLVPLGCGLGLCVYPYFVANIWLMLIIAVILMWIPWRYR